VRKIQIIKRKNGLKPIYIFWFLCILIINSNIYSQYAFRKKWTFNVNAGLSSYYGSFSQYKADPIRKFINESRPGAGIALSKHLSPILQLRGDFLTAGLASEKRDSSAYYQGSFMEFTVNGKVNVVNIIMGEQEDRKAHAYLFLGMGMSIINSQFHNMENEEGIVPEDPQKVTSSRFVIPFGLAFDLKVGKNLDLTLDISRHLLKTSILGTDFDYYNYTAIGLSYNFDFPRNFHLNLKRKRYEYVEHDDKALNKYMRRKNKWRRNPGPLIKKHHKRRPKRKIGG
jgi:hypothetical protein